MRTEAVRISFYHDPMMNPHVTDTLADERQQDLLVSVNGSRLARQVRPGVRRRWQEARARWRRRL
jgi:hypothetical protein